jgi:cytochrome c5
MYQKTCYFLALGALVIISACKTKTVSTAAASAGPVNPAPVVRNDIKPEWLDIAREMDASATMQQLAAGKDIYYGTCTKCHGWKDARKYDADAWERVLQAMIPKAKLTPDEAHHLRLYTLVFKKN